MPNNPSYQSQLGTPATSGQPEIPTALAGYLDPLIHGLQKASGELIEQGAKREQVESITAGEQVLQGVYTALHAKSTELADLGPDPTKYNPLAQGRAFSQFAQQAHDMALQVAGQHSRVAQAYVAQHIRQLIDPRITAFDALMTKRYTEKQDYDTLLQVDTLTQQAAAAPTPGEAKDLLGRINDLVGGRADWTGEYRQKVLFNARMTSLLGRYQAEARKDPVKAIDLLMHSTPSELGLPPDVHDEAIKVAAQAWHLQDSIRTSQRTQQEHELSVQRDAQYIADMTKLDKGLSRTQIDENGRAGKYKPDQYVSLQHGALAYEAAGGPGNPGKAAQIVKELEINPSTYSSEELQAKVKGLNKPQVAEVYNSLAASIQHRHAVEDDLQHPFHTAPFQNQKSMIGQVRALATGPTGFITKPDLYRTAMAMELEHQQMVEDAYKKQRAGGPPVDYRGIMDYLWDKYAGVLSQENLMGTNVDPRSSDQNIADLVKGLKDQIDRLSQDERISLADRRKRLEPLYEQLRLFKIIPAPAKGKK